MKVTARLQQLPSTPGEPAPPKLDRISVEPDDYRTALTDLQAKVPAGWGVIAWMVDRDLSGAPAQT